MFLKRFIITIILSGILNVNVYGNEKGYVCRWSYDDDCNVEYNMEEVVFECDISPEKKAILLFDKFFNECDNNYVNFIPDGTELIAVKLDDGHLNVYVSSEIKTYGGGSAWELSLVEGILRTAFSLPEVKDISLYIGGQIDFLPESIMLDGYRKEDYIWNK